MPLSIRVLSLLIVVYCFVFNINAYAESENDCGHSERTFALAKLIQEDQEQQRIKLICNATLTGIAQAKAQEMASKGDVNHFGHGGPNERLRDHGYQLPRYYPGVGSNQVEAVAGGYGDPVELWEKLKASPAHRSHLLGEHPFYLEQYELGVGYARREDSPHEHYWAIYLAKPRVSDEDCVRTEGGDDVIPEKGESDVERVKSIND